MCLTSLCKRETMFNWYKLHYELRIQIWLQLVFFKLIIQAASFSWNFYFPLNCPKNLKWFTQSKKAHQWFPYPSCGVWYTCLRLWKCHARVCSVHHWLTLPLPLTAMWWCCWNPCPTEDAGSLLTQMPLQAIAVQQGRRTSYALPALGSVNVFFGAPWLSSQDYSY